ncbi:MAG: glycosyltransferase family 39 protein [Deltaproteobacteria bacterium]|nr:glycosyltransferase family 39 protein [Deltaproteobacteria bacterium]
MNFVSAFWRRIPETIRTAVVAALAQIPFVDRSVVSLDEGQVTAIGQRLLSGEVLYRDVYTGIFPGIYWLAAALFRVFGTDVLVLRWTQLVVNAATAACLLALVRPLAPGRARWLVPIGYMILVVVSFPVFTMLAYSSLSLLAALCALLMARRYLATARPLDGVLTGLSLGVCVLFKQNYGALALLAVFASLVWNRRDSALADKPLLRALAFPVLGGSSIGATAALAIACSGAFPSFVSCTLLTIFRGQIEAFDQPLPPVFGSHPSTDGRFLFLYSPGLLFGYLVRGHPWGSPRVISLAIRAGYASAYFALAIAPLCAWRLSRHRDAEVRRTARAVTLFAPVFFLGIFPSAIWSHLVAVYPTLLLIDAAAITLVLRAIRTRRPAVASGLTKVAATFGGVILLVGAAAMLDLRRWYSEPMRLPGATLRVSRREASLYRNADDFLRACAPPGTAVFVAPDMPLLYVTSARTNPTPYDLVIPGDVRDEVLVAGLRDRRVDCVVLNSRMYVQFASFERLFPRLAQYLQTNFANIRELNVEGTAWEFLRRKRPS